MSKKALITGASEGIGRAFAVALARDGHSITAVARSENKLQELVKELGPKHKYIVADLTSQDGQEQVARELTSEKYNLLVNNAGVGSVGNFRDTAVEKLLHMMHLNCDAVVRLAHAFLKKSVRGDALINVSSTLAFMPMPSLGLYCATKSLVTALSESLWFEQRSRGVYVMGLCPGITQTQFQINAGGKKEDLPANMAQSPEQVVEIALKALKKRDRPTVISGTKNLVFASISRLMPRKSTVSILGKMMEHH